jgi:hypothetical protein
MSMQRILRYLRPARARAPARNWWLTVTEQAAIRVSERAARAALAAMRRWRPTEWLELRDIHGSRVVLRSRDVRLVAESTPEQRASYRAWQEERRSEAGAGEERPFMD